MRSTTSAVAATRLILVRHGEPCESVRGRCYGRLDPPLSHTGQEQMAALGRHLMAWGDAAVYSSPLRRAIESAVCLTGAAARPIIDDRFRELDFGVIEGLMYDEVERAYPAVFQAWMQRPTEVTCPGGESVAAMAARVREAVADLLRARPNQTTVVVSHGGVNRIVLADALGLPLASMFRLGQDYACFNVVEYCNGHTAVRAMNVPAGLPC